MTTIHLLASLVAISCTLVGFYESFWRDRYDKGSFYMIVSMLNLMLLMHL
jgi:hypothetical protein